MSKTPYELLLRVVCWSLALLALVLCPIVWLLLPSPSQGDSRFCRVSARQGQGEGAVGARAEIANGY